VEFRDIVKQQMQDEMHSVNGNLNKVMRTIQITKEQADEQRNKENRRNNMVLYNVPESELAKEVKLTWISVWRCLTVV